MKTVTNQTARLGGRALLFLVKASLPMKTVTNETALFGTEPLFKRFTNENGAKTKRPYWGPSPF